MSEDIKNTEAVNENVVEEVLEKEAQEVEADGANTPDEEKQKMVDEFNEKFSEYATLTREDAANLEDFKKEAEAKFDELTKGFATLELDIETTNSKKALAVAKFLKEWNAKFAKWTNQEWKAVIHFDEVIDGKITEIQNQKTDKLALDVYSITYIFDKMKEPEAFGIESARLMNKYETKNEKKENAFAFVDVLHVLMSQIQYMQCLNKQATILQNVVAMAENGYKLELKITELEEFVKFFDAMQNQN